MPQPALIEVHEDRISRLEGDVTECRVDLGVLKSQLSDGVKLLSEKMDAVSESHAALSARIGEIEVREKVRGRLVKIAIAGFGLACSAGGFIIKLLLS